MKEYPRALSTAYRLFTQWATIESYKPLQTPKETIENISSAYYNNRLDHPDLIWFYKQIQFFLYDIRQELESFDNSIRSLIPQNIFVLAKSDDYGVDLRLVLCALANNYLVYNNMAKLFAKLRDEPWIKEHPPERTINEIIPEDTINEMRKKQPRINIGWNISTRIIHSLCEESLQILEQYCQLLNIIVYDRIELNLDHNDAQAYTTQNMQPANSISKIASLVSRLYFPQRTHHSVNSISKIASLASPLNQSNQATIEDAINIMTVLLRFANEQGQEHNYASRYKENLRNYYDTKGWMIFRSVFPYQRFEPGAASASSTQEPYDPTKQVELQVLLTQFEQARHWLTKGLSYDPSNAILYYHLARVHLAIMERLWQSRKSTKASDIADIAAMFQDHLRQAASCWRRALNYDTSGRLRSSLNWLGQRIEQYSRDWKYRFLSSLRHGLPNDSNDE